MIDFIVASHEGWMLAITAAVSSVLFFIGCLYVWWSPRWKSRKKPHAIRHLLLRLLLIDALALGGYYIIWRTFVSINPNALWFGIPLVLVEIYAYIDVGLFTLNMWPFATRGRRRPRGGETVDVFIPTYNEPVELVLLTAQAALNINWPDKKVYILDDGNRGEMRKLAKSLGCEYIARGDEWQGKPRHAKAGNINNALMQTNGEFILVLDADQIPDSRIIRNTIGYFKNPKLAFVQTPQYFYNLLPNDPFGNDAPLFYGPILSGRDGWNAAFFCGSNAILRREALMQLGLMGFSDEMEKQLQEGLRSMSGDIMRRSLFGWRRLGGMSALKKALDTARKEYGQGAPLMEVSKIIREGLTASETEAASQALSQVRQDLEALAANGDQEAAVALASLGDESDNLAKQLAALQTESGQHAILGTKTMEKLEQIRGDEAVPVLPLSTISVTEDIATALRLHALGWESVFHSQILAYGLAPEDLAAALAQRLRWAEGNVKVLLADNPLFMKGLTFPQRLMYFSTLYNYLGGFANLIFLLTPAVYLFTLVSPLVAFNAEFLWRLAPYIVVTKLAYGYAAHGLDVRRSEYFNVALFALWIRAFLSVVTGRQSEFVVTPKQRQSGNFLGLIWPQLIMLAILLLSLGFGAYDLYYGLANPYGIAGAMVWGAYYAYILSTLVRAAVFQAPQDWDPKPPAFLFAERG